MIDVVICCLEVFLWNNTYSHYPSKHRIYSISCKADISSLHSTGDGRLWLCWRIQRWTTLVRETCRRAAAELPVNGGICDASPFPGGWFFLKGLLLVESVELSLTGHLRSHNSKHPLNPDVEKIAVHVPRTYYGWRCCPDGLLFLVSKWCAVSQIKGVAIEIILLLKLWQSSVPSLNNRSVICSNKNPQIK